MIAPTHRSLWRNRDGVTAIEFAMVVPVLVMFLMSTLEFGMIFFAEMTLESSVSNSSRLGKTGYAGTGISRQQTIMNMLSQKSGGMFDMSKVSITTLAYPTFDSVGDPEPFQDKNGNGQYNAGEPYTDVNGNGQRDADMGAAGLGNANDVVLYTVTYPWPMVTPFMRPFIGTNGIYTLTTRTVVKNEPY